MTASTTANAATPSSPDSWPRRSAAISLANESPAAPAPDGPPPDGPLHPLAPHAPLGPADPPPRRPLSALEPGGGEGRDRPPARPPPDDRSALPRALRALLLPLAGDGRGARRLPPRDASLPALPGRRCLPRRLRPHLRAGPARGARPGP